jgi:hypothetical protein
MRVVDKTKTAERSQMLTTDIPVGQVFRGTVKGPNSGRLLSGVFYKAWGTARIFGVGRLDHAAHILVRLDVPDLTPGYANVILYATVVRGYEPLDVELVITGVGK